MLKYDPQKSFGARILDGGVQFRLWAPNQDRVSLSLTGHSPPPMHSEKDGWHELISSYELSDGLEVPDPASRFQPADVDGPSEVIDPERYHWEDDSWTGRPWEECVICELHVGAFTEQAHF